MPLRRLILLVALLLGACGLPTYRYRMTVEVDAPEGLRTGSSVIEVRSSDGPELYKHVNGQAAFVDLPNRQTLFVLLTSGDFPPDVGAGLLAFNAFNSSMRGRRSYAAGLNSLVHEKRFAVLRQSAYPDLVIFKNINGPRTIQILRPDHLSDALGTGIQCEGSH